jgi:ATP-dependent helicase HrpA
MEELRIAMYAQELKTPTPMSIKRIEKILNTFRG